MPKTRAVTIALTSSGTDVTQNAREGDTINVTVNFPSGKQSSDYSYSAIAAAGCSISSGASGNHGGTCTITTSSSGTAYDLRFQMFKTGVLEPQDESGTVTGSVGDEITQFSITSGEIDFGDIQTFWGGSNPIEISEYYRGGSHVPSLSDTGDNDNIPTSGEISISDFYGMYKET
tara:strand:+ start:307 stop:831 length:525 start_codon:yes stop_codon:yes gene_type:complete